MGNDGGSIPDRRDLVKQKPKAQKADANNIRRAQWSQCALSKRPLQQPVVLDPLGKLINKDALLEYLLDRTTYGDGESVCGYIQGMKDTTTLKLTHNPNLDDPSLRVADESKDATTNDNAPPKALFVCPLSLKEMNGSIPFVALSTCGCVFSLAALKAVVASSPAALPSPPNTSDEEKEKGKALATDIREVPCPQCSKSFAPSSPAKDHPYLSTLMPINPPQSEQHETLIALNAYRASKPSKKMKKRKAEGEGEEGKKSAKKLEKEKENQAAVASTPTIAGSRGGALAKSVRDELKREEEKRKAGGMSAAVASLYAPKGGKEDTGFMTGRTFGRYA